MRRLILLISLATCALSFSRLAHAQFFADYRGVYVHATNKFYFDGRSYNAWTRYKVKHDENAIYVYDFKTDRQSKIFSASDKVTSFAMSPDDKMMACIMDSINGKELLIISNDGQLKHKVDGQIQQFVWSSDSNSIIFITGRIVMRPEASNLIPDGVWSYNLSTKEKKKIAEKGWYLRAVIFNRDIYFYNGDKIVKYSENKKVIEESDVKNTNLSFNKRYYYYYSDIEDSDAFSAPYWSPFRIFDTYVNQDLPAEKILFISEREPGDVIWAKDGKTIIFRGNKERNIYTQEIFIYNLDANRLVKRFPGVIVGLDHERTKLVLLRDGKFVLEYIVDLR